MLEESEVGGHLGRGLGDSAQEIEDLGVGFPAVGLAGDGERFVEAELPGDEPIEVADLGVVAAEQFEERGLRAGGPFAAAGPQGLEPVEQVLDVEGKVLGPEGGPFPDGGQLRRLEVGVGQTREAGVAFGKGA